MTKVRATWLGRGLIAAVCLVALIGWFGVQAGHAQDHSTVMKDSGFKQWQVNTPKEQAYFKTHPTDKVVTYKQKNKTVHVFKDPQSGNVYYGDDAAHQTYLQKVKVIKLSPKPQEDSGGSNDPEFWTMLSGSED